MSLRLLILVLLFSNVLSAQSDSCKLFIFGHSLLDHRPPLIPTPSNETTVPHWLSILADLNAYPFAATGQYGFLPQHTNLPPIAQWGYDTVPPAWDSDNDSFHVANFNLTILTPGNFMQWQGPNEPYYGNDSIWTPISATEEITNWVLDQEDTMKVYIYENWPDMAPYLGNGFPPTEAEFQNYNDYLLGDFHDWFLEYQDSVLARVVEHQVRMIPAGPIIAHILMQEPYSDILITELYEDDAPHGRASTYFLAALISHMAIWEEKAPYGYAVPNTVDSTIAANYDSLVDIIWQELLDFDDDEGNSRVFCENITSSVDLELQDSCLKLYPNPVEDLFQLEGELSEYAIEIVDEFGNLFQSINVKSYRETIDISNLPAGIYFLRAENIQNASICIKKIIKLE